MKDTHKKGIKKTVSGQGESTGKKRQVDFPAF